MCVCRQHLPKKLQSSFSREAQSKLQNMMLYLLCVVSLARMVLL